MTPKRLTEALESNDPSKAFIIAEIGSNWRDIHDCIVSIRQAKKHGADAVKFQLYTGQELHGPNSDHLPMPGELPSLWLPLLKDHAFIEGIEFMCSAFSVNGLRQVNPFVNIHKIASAEFLWDELREAAYLTDKPLVLSSGGSSLSEISDVVHRMSENERKRTTLLHCVAEYPAKYPNLRNIEFLSKTLPLSIGYSDHTPDYRYIPAEAARLGAKVIEKHVDFIGLKDTPDAPHSISGNHFRLMVDRIRHPFLGYDGPHLPEEADMIYRDRRGLVTTAPIKKGEMLSYGFNFGSFRLKSRDTFKLYRTRSAEGKLAARDMPIGHSINLIDVIHG